MTGDGDLFRALQIRGTRDGPIKLKELCNRERT